MRKVAIAITIILVVGWVTSMLIAAQHAYQAHNDLKEWLSVQGEVFILRTEAQYSDGIGTNSVTVGFSYIVEDVPYYQTQYWFGKRGEGDKYHRGAAITIYYNPAKPEEAVIELSKVSSPWEQYMFYSVLIPIIGCMIIWTWEGRGKERKRDNN